MTSYQQPAAEPAYPPPTSEPDVSMNDPSMKDRATEAMDQGKQAAGQVAQTATEHVQEVKDETVRQARDLLGEAREQVTRQAGDQHRNLVSNLRSLSSELGSMVERSEQPGTATELVSQARDKVDGAADWLDGRQPGDLVDELKNFARRRPGTFLLGALAAGVVAGRLTRGAVAAHTESSDGAASVSAPTAGSGVETGAGIGPAAETVALPPATNGAPAGYSMGGRYGEPVPGTVPPVEQGNGATSTYGDTRPQPYPSAGYPGEGYAGEGYPSGGYPNGGVPR